VSSSSTPDLVLRSIHVYPVKATRAVDPESCVVEPIGLVGDRRFMIVDDAGNFLTQRTLGGLARVSASLSADRLTLEAATDRFELPLGGDGPDREVTIFKDRVSARDCGEAAANWLTAVLGRSARLVVLADPKARPVDPDYARAGEHVSFADGYPLLLANEASLSDLNGRLAEPVTMRRFRPNIVISGAAAWAEDTWRRIRVGAVEFRIAKPCRRCVVTTLDPDTGDQADKAEPLLTLRSFHRDHRGGAVFGQNLVPLSVGTISLGDPVEVLETGPSNLIPQAD